MIIKYILKFFFVLVRAIRQQRVKEPEGLLPPLHKLAIEPYLEQNLPSLQLHNPLFQIHFDIILSSTSRAP